MCRSSWLASDLVEQRVAACHFATLRSVRTYTNTHARSHRGSRDRQRGCRSTAHEIHTSTWYESEGRARFPTFRARRIHGFTRDRPLVATVVVVVKRRETTTAGARYSTIVAVARARSYWRPRVCENRAGDDGGSRFRRCAADKKFRRARRRTWLCAATD